jgi:hypothetical protein
VLVVCFVLHLSMTKTALSLLTCTQLAPGHPYLLGDLNIACGSAEGGRLFIVGLTGILLYALGIPACSFLVLWQRRARLQEPTIQAKYGFLYKQYKPETWYWETVTLLRKVGLALIAVLLATQGTGVQVTCSMVLLVLSLVGHLLYMPHHLPLLNTVEAASLTVAVVTLAGGAVLVDERSPEAWKESTTVALLAVNGAFLACMAYLLLRAAVMDEAVQAGLRSALLKLCASSASVAQALKPAPRRPPPSNL